jgi:2-keto-4-pentenoate hydratase
MPESDAELQQIAAHLVAARRQARPLGSFPGVIPPDLDLAYRIQDFAINLWGDRVVGGWKVGRIPPDIEEAFGIDRLAGPIFADTIVKVDSGAVQPMPIIEGGFAAIEAEFVAVIDRDAPDGKLAWSLDESLDMIADLRIGLEIASSPLSDINDLGPTAVVSDHGNNLGLVVGPTIENWRNRSLDSMSCSTIVNQEQVGTGGAFTLTGGFVRSVQFLLELAAHRNTPLRAGDMIATGQTTGIHDVEVGQTGTTDFGDDGSVCVTLVAASPAD